MAVLLPGRFVASLETDLTVRAKTSEVTVADFCSGSYSSVFRDEVSSQRPSLQFIRNRDGTQGLRRRVGIVLMLFQFIFTSTSCLEHADQEADQTGARGLLQGDADRSVLGVGFSGLVVWGRIVRAGRGRRRREAQSPLRDGNLIAFFAALRQENRNFVGEFCMLLIASSSLF